MTKWISVKTYVDEETGEVLDHNTYRQGPYVLVRQKIIHTKVNNYGTKHIYSVVRRCGRQLGLKF